MKTPEQKGELFSLFTVFTANEGGLEPGNSKKRLRLLPVPAWDIGRGETLERFSTLLKQHTLLEM